MIYVLRLHTPLIKQVQHIDHNTYTQYTTSDIRIRYQLNTTAYTYTHEIPTMFTSHYPTQRHYGCHILWFFPLLLQCRTPYSVVQSLLLLKMGIVMPETCWDRSLIINIRLVVSLFILHGVEGTSYPLHSPVSLSHPNPCVTECHHILTGLYPRKWFSSVSNNLPWIRVCFCVR